MQYTPVYLIKYQLFLYRPRDHGGMRLSWALNKETTFGQRWNPFASDFPMMTFCHHPLIYNEKERDTITYNMDDFYESILQQIKKVSFCY